jgi:putative DNA primase/helicase
MTADRPSRPDPLTLDPDTVPETLREREAWVCWRYKRDTDRDEWTKVPVDPATDEYASSTDPETWGGFADAVAHHEDPDTDTDGVGYVVSDEDVVVGIDLDDCRNPETGDLDPWARDVLDTVETYAEVSPSGTGLRLFGLGFVPDGGTRADVEGVEGHIEMYDSGRYLTVTGHALDHAAEDVQQVHDAIEDVHAEYIADDGAREPDESDANLGVEAGTPGGAVDLTDETLIEKAKSAANGEKFRQLWNGTTSGYPSHSEADLALCDLLAFWTGGDRSRIDDLFRQSGLYRGKWDRDDYRERTIDKALDSRTEYYDPSGGEQAAADGGVAAASGGSTGPTPDASSDARTTTLLTPRAVGEWAELNDDEDIAALSDRAKAAAVWELVHRHDDVHVCVRPETDALWAYDDGIWTPDGERVLRQAARRALGPTNFGANVVSELKAQARGDERHEVPAERFGVEPGTIAVENGLLNLPAAADGREDALRDLQPDDYAQARLPVEYDPDATAAEWRDYVQKWAEDGRAKALKEYVGYCLHVNAMPIHRALLLVGSGANGKSTFLAVVRKLLGDENTTSTELQTLANERDALADFEGALANVDDDLSARQLGAGLGMFKKLTAGNRVRARRLYESGFKFTATGKHLYAANEVPDVDVPDEDEAFWRRWLLVEFPNYYPPSERDHSLGDRLTDDEVLSGVLNWAIEGWERLLDQGHFTNEDRLAHDKRERWQAWGDSVDKFIADCVETDPDADRISTTDVYERYTAWCHENGEDPASPQALTTSLKTEDLGYTQSLRIDGGSPQRGFKRLGFTDEAPDQTATEATSGGEQSRL